MVEIHLATKFTTEFHSGQTRFFLSRSSLKLIGGGAIISAGLTATQTPTTPLNATFSEDYAYCHSSQKQTENDEAYEENFHFNSVVDSGEKFAVSALATTFLRTRLQISTTFGA